MKQILILITFLVGSVASADSLNIPAEYEMITAQASCKAVSCEEADPLTGEQACRYKIFFSEESFAVINELKTEKGYKKTWFEKSPNQICEAGELPISDTETKEIRVLLYNLDLSGFNDLFK